jgi:hypothetical protein
MLVFDRMGVAFSLVVITEGSAVAVRRPVNVHIESDGLHRCGTELLALGLFFFVKRGCWGRCTDLDDFWEE